MRKQHEQTAGDGKILFEMQELIAIAALTGKYIACASIHLRGGERLFQVEHLLASDRTELFQQSKILARFVDLPGFNVELAQIFERALVLGIEIERLAVEGVGLLIVA